MSAFAALRGDGTVYTWGHRGYGACGEVGVSNIKTVFSHSGQFAFLAHDGEYYENMWRANRFP